MSMFVPLIEALKNGKIKSEDFIYYEPDELKVMCCPDSGEFATKRLRNELGLGWHPVLYKGFAVLLIADKVTELKWTMTELLWHNFGAYEEYFRLYDNKELGSLGVVPTEEILKEIPEDLKKADVLIYSPKKPEISYRSRRIAFNPGYPHYDRYEKVFSLKYYEKAMQPIVALPFDTMVDLDDKKRNGKSKSKAIRLYSKEQLIKNGFSQDVREFYDETMWISLKEAMIFGRIKPTEFVNYVPEESSVIFTSEETGARYEQIAKTEYALGGWHPIVETCVNGQHLHIVSHCASKFELEMTSNVQFKDGCKLLNKYAQIYSNPKIGAKARSFTEEIFLEALKNSLVFEKDVYWLATSAVDPVLMGPRGQSWINPVKGLKWIAKGCGGRYIQQPMDTFLEVGNSIRIAILFFDEIMVQINNPERDGSSEAKAYNLKRKVFGE